MPIILLEQTVIHATLLDRDLIPAFAEELKKIDNEGKHKEFAKHALKLAKKLQRAEKSRAGPSGELLDEASEMIELLLNKLNLYAPEGYYFGAHPGNGSDFGFWREEEDV